MTPYSTIVVDPPWDVAAGRALGRYVMEDGVQQFGPSSVASRPLAYSSMPVDEICALPVRYCAAENAHLYLWTINRYLQDAFRVAAAWGFTYSTTLVWAKAPMGGGLGGCYGIATEFVLFCRRGALAATAREPRTWFNWKRPYDKRGKPKHSAKPPEFYHMVERISPGPRLEMFARGNRAGWDCWGDECESVELPHMTLPAKQTGYRWDAICRHARGEA